MQEKKSKSNIPHTILHWFTYHPWLKIISLILSVIVWLYVRGEINRFNY